MKVYITSNINFEDEIDESVKEIVSSVESHGNGTSLNVKNVEHDQKVDDKLLNDIYKKSLTAIKNSDFVIAEMSYPSASIGYEISFAISEKKPVLVLYNASKATDVKMEFSLLGNNSKYIRVRKYTDKEDIKSSIKYFVEDIKDIIDTKFILIIPAYIDKYLEWNVKHKGMSKAEVTRNAIEVVMEKDIEYENYSKSDSQ